MKNDSGKYNIFVIPFHDWRKCKKEGFRTRDAHITSHFIEDPEIGKVVILNRPITALEMVMNHMNWKTNGSVIYEKGNIRMVQIHEKVYIIDYYSSDFIGNVINLKRWFNSAYSNRNFIKKVHDLINETNCDIDLLISFNIFAAAFYDNFPTNNKIFDAWDNLLRFPEYSNLRSIIYSNYTKYSKSSRFWITNSETNKDFFTQEFELNECHIIKNGVDIERFNKKYSRPHEYKNLNGPIIGFGGKITHLFDENLYNYLLETNPEMDFVIVGQILDREKYRRINKTPNFHYFGDKHYDDYPIYVTNFDVCIMPYLVGDREHGGDAIKLYEYISANKPIVSTSGNGASSLREFVQITDNPILFSEMIRNSILKQFSYKMPSDFSWKNKAETILRLTELI